MCTQPRNIICFYLQIELCAFIYESKLEFFFLMRISTNFSLKSKDQQNGVQTRKTRAQSKGATRSINIPREQRRWKKRK